MIIDIDKELVFIKRHAGYGIEALINSRKWVK